MPDINGILVEEENFKSAPCPGAGGGAPRAIAVVRPRSQLAQFRAGFRLVAVSPVLRETVFPDTTVANFFPKPGVFERW